MGAVIWDTSGENIVSALRGSVGLRGKLITRGRLHSEGEAHAFGTHLPKNQHLAHARLSPVSAPCCVRLSPSMGYLLEKDSDGLFKACQVTRDIHHARGLMFILLFPFCKILPRWKKKKKNPGSNKIPLWGDKQW